MAAATLGATYSPPSPLELHYSDNTSSIHPDRPIRPLPKRRLRSRLSSEAADSILYPSDETTSRPSLQAPYEEPSRRTNGVTEDLPNGTYSAAEDIGEATNNSYQFRGNDLGGNHDAVIMRRYQEQRARPTSGTALSSKSGYTRSDGSKWVKPPISQSTASSNDSIDGYDSFENTNNKKKRKIPMSGSLGNHQSSLSTDMAQMGLSSTQDIDTSLAEGDSGIGHYYGSGSSAIPTVPSGNGISGAGRGRYSRTSTRRHSGRSPLGVSVNGSNTLQANRSLQYPRENPSIPNGQKEPAPAKSSDQGIISAAIASAAALPATPIRGQENTSLFEQQASQKPSSTKTQFTFTCESDSAKSMAWPDVSSPLSRWDNDAAYAAKSRSMQNGRSIATSDPQTSPNVNGQSVNTAHQQSGEYGQASQQPRKLRRPLAKQYKIAARDRQLRQEYSNYHHPPKEEDIWICQFCEYESIFGEKPQHLIRQYEAKDRRERKRLAEKRRLLEKAKMKSKKGKKGNKNSKTSHAAAQTQQQQNPKHSQDNQQEDDASMLHQNVPNDECGLDEYDENPSPVPMRQQTPSKIPQPITQNQTHSLRPPSGSSTARQGAITGRETYF